MRVSIRPEEPLMKKSGLQHSRKATRDCPICVSGLLTLAERDGTLDIYICIACGASVSLRHRPSMTPRRSSSHRQREIRNRQTF